LHRDFNAIVISMQFPFGAGATEKERVEEMANSICEKNTPLAQVSFKCAAMIFVCFHCLQVLSFFDGVSMFPSCFPYIAR
jgi:hypothetical protein